MQFCFIIDFATTQNRFEIKSSYFNNLPTL